MSRESSNATWTVCSCNHCANHLEFDPVDAGTTIKCPHCGRDTVLAISASPLYKTNCTNPNCGQRIEYTAEFFKTFIYCPACNEEIWIPQPRKPRKCVRFLKRLGKVAWNVLGRTRRIIVAVMKVLLEVLTILVEFAVGHFIGLVGLSFVLGTLIIAMFSPMLVAANVFLTGEGFGFVLIALDIIIHQNKRKSKT